MPGRIRFAISNALAGASSADGLGPNNGSGDGAAEAGQLDGLWVARRGERLVGAAWAQWQAGGVATVWPPRLVDDEPLSTSIRLALAIGGALQRPGVRLAQALIEVDHGLAAILCALPDCDMRPTCCTW